MVQQHFQLSDTQKGIALMVLGTLMFFYALNIFARWLNPIVAVSGVILVLVGFAKLGGVEYLRKLIKKNIK